jgi:hypothetical protein
MFEGRKQNNEDKEDDERKAFVTQVKVGMDSANVELGSLRIKVSVPFLLIQLSGL